MNIVREQREQNNSLIKVTVGEKDYGDAVEKSLREYKRKANIPGFRPGMVPMGVIKKMYGKGVLAEQAYRQASEAAFNYLQEQKIDYVGDVIPSEEQGDFDFENGTEFEFIFEIGEAPEVKLELSAKDKMTYYTIKVDKKMHDDYRSNFLRRFGRLVDTDKVTADEALEAQISGEIEYSGYKVRKGLEVMDKERVVELLHSTDWAKERSAEMIEQSMAQSISYGVFDKNDYQIGYARIISDLTTTFYLMDVVIDEAYRGRGLGKLLMDGIMEDVGHLHGILHTENAAGLYEKYGFREVKECDDKTMEKPKV